MGSLRLRAVRSLRRRRYSCDTKRTSPRPTKREITTQEFICVPVGPPVVCDVTIRFPDSPTILRPENPDRILLYCSTRRSDPSNAVHIHLKSEKVGACLAYSLFRRQIVAHYRIWHAMRCAHICVLTTYLGCRYLLVR